MPNSHEAGRLGNTIDKLDATQLFVRQSLSNYTYPSYDPRMTIDWILGPRDFNTAEYKVLNSDLSDHLPLVATFGIPEK